MELLLVILLVVVIAALAFAVLQTRRRRGAITANRVGRGTASPLPRQSRRARRHPMADAVQEHAQAMEPQEVVAAEHRLQAEAGRVASGLKADARRDEHTRAGDLAPAYADSASTAASARADGYADPAAHGTYAAGDPRHDRSGPPATRPTRGNTRAGATAGRSARRPTSSPSDRGLHVPRRYADTARMHRAVLLVVVCLLLAGRRRPPPR